MEKELQILIIEDDDADAIRLTHELESHDLSFRITRVAAREDFLSAIERQPPDLILSDHGLPSFSGFAALEAIQEKCPQVPFVFVTGSYDQGLMVEMFDSGAAGYVFKNRLSDLVPVIEQAMEEARAREAASRGTKVGSPEPAADQPGPRLSALDSRPPRLICARCKKVRSEGGDWEPLEAYFGKHLQATVTLGLCPSCATYDLHSGFLEHDSTP